MDSLNNIPKKDFFSVPENYFDELPGRIRNRLKTEKPHNAISPVLRYALIGVAPLLLIAVMIIFGYLRKSEPEFILGSVGTADLIQYLQESEVSTEELIENIDFTAEELEAFEYAVFDSRFQDETESHPK